MLLDWCLCYQGVGHHSNQSHGLRQGWKRRPNLGRNDKATYDRVGSFDLYLELNACPVLDEMYSSQSQDPA